MNDSGPTAGSAAYIWGHVGVLTLVNVVNYIDRTAFGVLLPEMQRDLGLSDSQVGIVAGLSFSIAYAVCAIPLARLADRGVRRTILAVVLAGWSMMTALCGAAQNFWHVLLARVGVGGFEAGGHPLSQSLICDFVPPTRRASAFALFIFGTTLGSGAGAQLGGMLAAEIGWRMTFVALGAPGLLLAALLYLFLREPLRGRFDPSAAQTRLQQPFIEALRALLRYRIFIYTGLYTVSYGFVYAGLTTWLPFFFTRIHHLDLPQVGTYLGIMYTTGPTIGLLIGGIVGDFFSRRSASAPLYAGAVGGVLSIAVWITALWVPDAIVALVLFSSGLFFLAISSGPLFAALQTAIDPDMRATGAATLNVAQAVLGGSLGPLLVGLVSDAIGPDAGPTGLRYAMLAPITIGPLIVVALYGAARNLPRDMALRALPTTH